MSKVSFGRRQFLTQSALTLAGLGVTVSWPIIAEAAREAAIALEKGEVLRVLSESQAADLSALADTIYPETDSPGASEIGAVWFMDRALAGFMQGPLPMITGALEAINAEIKQADNGGRALADLSLADREALLTARLETPFFNLLHFMTLCGVFAMPSYGGNRAHEGWRQIGFDHRHAWTSPFGYYDARYSEEGASS